jgi:hypothetical protein
MNWKKRLRKIAEENPDVLHPLLKDLEKSRDAGKAWYRVSWFLDDFNPEDSARPMKITMNWLAKKGLLSTYGIEEFKKINSNLEQAALTEPMVVLKARDFMDKYFEKWLDQCGTNYSIDASTKEDHSMLENMWKEYGFQKKNS